MLPSFRTGVQKEQYLSEKIGPASIPSELEHASKRIWALGSGLKEGKTQSSWPYPDVKLVSAVHNEAQIGCNVGKNAAFKHDWDIVNVLNRFFLFFDAFGATNRAYLGKLIFQN